CDAESCRRVAACLHVVTEIDLPGDGKVCGEEHAFRPDLTSLRPNAPKVFALDGNDAGSLEHLPARTDDRCRQPDAIERRIELRLIGEAEPAAGGKRQRRAIEHVGGQTETECGLRFRLDIGKTLLVSLDPGDRRPPFEVTGDGELVDAAFNEFCAFAIGIGVKLRLLATDRPDQVIVNEPMLRGDLGRRAPRDLPANPQCLDDGDGAPRFCNLQRGRQPYDPAADDGDVDSMLPLERGIARLGRNDGPAAVGLSWQGAHPGCPSSLALQSPREHGWYEQVPRWPRPPREPNEPTRSSS